MSAFPKFLSPDEVQPAKYFLQSLNTPEIHLAIRLLLAAAAITGLSLALWLLHHHRSHQEPSEDNE